MRIDTGQVTLSVTDQGTGEPALVFLHCWGGSARTWSRVVAHLHQTYRCVAYDHRGWGTSDAPEDSNTLDDLARDARALIAALGLQRYVLVGHSMGGKAAMLLASQRPAGLQALVLVAPASPFPQRISREAQEAQRHAYDSRNTALAAVDFLIWHKLNSASMEQLVEDSLCGSRQAKAAWPSTESYRDISDAARRIAVPTMVVVGDHDPQNSPEQQRKDVLPVISGSSLVVLEACGHLAPVEQPAALAESIARFVSTEVKQADTAPEVSSERIIQSARRARRQA